MSIRILHCSDNVNNYNTCVEKQICGFGNRGPATGDTIYLAVKINGNTICGARCKLTTVTDENPWNDGVDYANILRAEDFEFCEPFPLNILSTVGGKYWAVKYVQAAKPISDKDVITLLKKTFDKQKIDNFIPFDISDQNIDNEHISEKYEIDDTIEDTKEAEKIKKENPDVKMQIMGTFQAIQFVNESDKINGLETLVNENFYSLFPEFEESRIILIAENRMFMTSGKKKTDGSNIAGIKTIPDALLLKFDPKMKSCPIRVYLIEYECYGKAKNTTAEKSLYLNSTVIPQLMRFAAGFSITTDKETRQKTIKTWTDKFLQYIGDNKILDEKIEQWIRELKPDINPKAIYFEMTEQLRLAFEKNICVLLIIDELTREQKDTINNIINAFKLENGKIDFEGYVISLVERINIEDMNAQYALTVKK